MPRAREPWYSTPQGKLLPLFTLVVLGTAASIVFDWRVQFRNSESQSAGRKLDNLRGLQPRSDDSQ